MKKYRIFMSTLCIALAAMLICPVAFAVEGEGTAAEGEDSADGEKKIDYKKLKNPIKFTEKSIARGKTLYLRYQCAGCHGLDGKAQIDVIADATDLTVPKFYRSGSTPGEIFRSIKEGAGLNMPPYKLQIKKDDDMWHMTNFVQSLWPAKERPKLVKPEDEEKAGDEEESSEEATTDGQD